MDLMKAYHGLGQKTYCCLRLQGSIPVGQWSIFQFFFIL